MVLDSTLQESQEYILEKKTLYNTRKLSMSDDGQQFRYITNFITPNVVRTTKREEKLDFANNVACKHIGRA